MFLCSITIFLYFSYPFHMVLLWFLGELRLQAQWHEPGGPGRLRWWGAGAHGECHSLGARASADGEAILLGQNVGKVLGKGKPGLIFFRHVFFFFSEVFFGRKCWEMLDEDDFVDTSFWKSVGKILGKPTSMGKPLIFRLVGGLEILIWRCPEWSGYPEKSSIFGLSILNQPFWGYPYLGTSPYLEENLENVEGAAVIWVDLGASSQESELFAV